MSVQPIGGVNRRPILDPLLEDSALVIVWFRPTWPTGSAEGEV